MLQQDSGSMARKAQAKLKVLATRHEQGKDMGVPVHALPGEETAWAGEGLM
jgi:hypothetical protein